MASPSTLRAQALLEFELPAAPHRVDELSGPPGAWVYRIQAPAGGRRPPGCGPGAVGLRRAGPPLAPGRPGGSPRAGVADRLLLAAGGSLARPARSAAGALHRRSLLGGPPLGRGAQRPAGARCGARGVRLGDGGRGAASRVARRALRLPGAAAPRSGGARCAVPRAFVRRGTGRRVLPPVGADRRARRALRGRASRREGSARRRWLTARYIPELIFQSPSTLTNFMRWSSDSVNHFSPLGTATA